MSNAKTPVDGSWETMVDVLRERARVQGDRLAYTFLVDGETEEDNLTYAQVDARARHVAARLQALDAAGRRVLLLYPPGLDYVTAFLGCLYAGTIAVPAYPPDPFRLERTLPRFLAIVADAAPAIAMTTTAVLALSRSLQAQIPALRAMRWLATDPPDETPADAWQPPAIAADAIAFLQYTSGSTAAPKGVMLTHANLLHNQRLINEAVIEGDDQRGLSWLPPYHDMGLIGGILQPLYAGFPVVLMSPLHFLQQPRRWLQAISRYQITISGGPNFAYNLCVRKVKPEERSMLDLSRWTVAFNGAEPVRAASMNRFADAFAPCGFRARAFYPCYGLAEATLFVTGGDVNAPPVIAEHDPTALAGGRFSPNGRLNDATPALVGCGHSLGDQQLRIVSPDHMTHCPDGHIGEIWVSGPSIAQGYWRRDAESEATFHARIADTGEGPFLRTGDLGFLWQGELFVTGRLKDLIIVDGLNHYPQDIELTAETSHPALRRGCSAAFAMTVDGREQLVVAVEVARPARLRALADPVDSAGLTAAIRRAVAQAHELRVHNVILLQAGAIPKTSSGKIQRRACREAYELDRLARWSPEAFADPAGV